MRLLELTLVTCSLVTCSTCLRQQDKKDSVATTVSLETLVCGSCAKTIEKAVRVVDGVQRVEVDVDRKTATVTYLPARTSLEAIENSIVLAGYDANAKTRDPATYDKLDLCCKIDG